MSNLIRLATLDDVAQLVTLEAATFDYSQLGKRSFSRLLKSTSAHMFVVPSDKNDTVLKGYSLLLTRKNSAIWRLYSIAVATDARGQGVGRQLLEHALTYAKAHGAKALSLEVKVDNQAAIELYRRYDFEVVDVLPDYYPGYADGYRMRLSFT
ncbi:Ribosomal-protein-alanine acetyltransferase [Pseudidiomarina piscicola]|uniref:Ribosomal-protein-alanine acetyltransferase n=1 Tax=Pseudidiomarina piscicola TaxID=2614830 RepID=A0A6S6WNS1_9GAMM|nr:N-acetyltransferase [Pseudidiomarina piscicola]CAB0151595.1 Ribosomal-protein-alanine acetyltransferase [Pseudidiomarina piscicola]VZT41060.1 Ribosomal-protein-alanine acetyltransferase [Pseudomonas aeruginosa]